MTDTALTTAIKAIARRETLDPATLEAAFDLLLTGEAAPEEIGAFLTGLAVRGETATELTAGARIMRQHARKVHVEGQTRQPLRAAQVGLSRRAGGAGRQS